jgi:hypothetical protein
MQPSPDVVAQWLEEDCPNLAFRPVRDILAECLRGRLPRPSDEEIAELSEDLDHSVSLALEARASDYRRDGVQPPFEVSSDDGKAYFKALETPEQPLLASLRKMTPTAFEIFCKYILLNMGAEGIAEGSPYDGGVDFYAVGLSLGEKTEPSPPTARVFVIGQSKRYSVRNDITEVHLRGFVGGAIRKANKFRAKYPDRFGLLTPVLLAFWTTSDFTMSAKAFAKEIGIWYLNGTGLAQLAVRLGLGPAHLLAAEQEARQREDQACASRSPSLLVAITPPNPNATTEPPAPAT